MSGNPLPGSVFSISFTPLKNIRDDAGRKTDVVPAMLEITPAIPTPRQTCGGQVCHC
jgi:hypothetical protein